MAFKTTPLYQEYRKEVENNVRPTSEASAGGGPLISFHQIMLSSSACAYFKRFAESEFCVEPVLFW